MEQIGVDDICTARLFKVPDPKKQDAAQEEKKGENAEQEGDDENERELMIGDMSSLETLGLHNGGKLEVEVFFSIDISVQGAGGGYSMRVEVSPEEIMDTIENRVFFFKMFRQRGFQLYSPDQDRVYEDEELTQIRFRDSNLKNNSKLVLRPRKKQLAEGEEDSDEEDVMLVDEDGFEGGEDEIEDMDEQGEEEVEEQPDAKEPAPEDPEAQDGVVGKDEKKAEANGNSADGPNDKKAVAGNSEADAGKKASLGGDDKDQTGAEGIKGKKAEEAK